MPELPAEAIDSATVRAIYASHERSQKGHEEAPRRYLGASSIGKPCARQLWYDFHWTGRERFDGRMIRLFETGHLAESRFVAELRAIGCTVHEADESGSQFAVSTLAGHFGGHMDGVVIGVPDAPKTWHVLETKTHSHKSFRQLVLHGVREARPEHFAQCQIYMHLGDLTRALYLAVDKDTDELYSERLNYERDYALGLLDKAKSIIEAATPPQRISENPDYFVCRFCHHRELCHGLDGGGPAVPSAINCRTCCHSTPVIADGATWRCAAHRKNLTDAEQARGCNSHLFNPGLLPWAATTDSDDNWIEYGTDDLTFRNSVSGKFTSAELASATRKTLSLKVVK